MVKSDKMKTIKSIKELQQIIHQLHNYCRNFEDNYDPLMAVDEIAKILFVKLAEESFSKRRENRFSYTGLLNSKDSATEWLNKLLDENIARVPGGFPVSEGTKLSDKTIVESVKKLENVNLSQADPDVKGVAYESILGKIFRGNLGQYFTPHTITEFMVKLVNPEIDSDTEKIDKVIDPGVGCGGFLTKTVRHYGEKIGNDPTLLDEIPNAMWGIDKVERMVRICSMNLILSGKDIWEVHKNIYCGNSLLTENSGFSVRSLQKDKSITIPLNKFDCLLTNPPFGSMESQDVATSIFSSLKNVYRNTEALFIKRSVELVRPGGKIAIVVPKTILKGPRFRDLQNWIKKETVVKAVIHLPLAAFVPFGSCMKTSILYMVKRDGKVRQGPVFFDAARFIGHDSSGASIPQNDLPWILHKYQNKQGFDYDR